MGARGTCWPCLCPAEGRAGAGASPLPQPRTSLLPSGPFLSEFTSLRLERGNDCSGYLQVYYNGTWGSVCSNSMTLRTASLACKELGCGDEGTLDTQLPSGKLSGTAWLDRVQCGEKNSSFWQCPSAPWNPESCDTLQEKTHITCNGNCELPGQQRSPSSCSLLGSVKGRDSPRGLLLSVPEPAASGDTNGPQACPSGCQLGSRQLPREAEVSPGKVSEETSHGSEQQPCHGPPPAAL